MSTSRRSILAGALTALGTLVTPLLASAGPRKAAGVRNPPRAQRPHVAALGARPRLVIVPNPAEPISIGQDPTDPLIPTLNLVAYNTDTGGAYGAEVSLNTTDPVLLYNAIVARVLASLAEQLGPHDITPADVLVLGAPSLGSSVVI